VEGLSAAKRSIVWDRAERHNINVICLSRKLTLTSVVQAVFLLVDLTSSAAPFMPNIGVCCIIMRNDLIDVSPQLSSSHSVVVKIGGYNIANVYKPPTEPWENTPIHSLLCHIQLHTWRTSTATIQTGAMTLLTTISHQVSVG